MHIPLKAKMALAFAAYSLRLSRVPVGPLFVTLETGSRCNLLCPMCPQSTHDEGHPHGSMSLETFDELLHRVRRFSPIACLTLHLSGEPLLHPDLPEMLRRAERVLKRPAGFSSNGYSLTRQRAEELVDAGLGWINFDFCADVEVFEKNRHPAKWERTYRNIRGFLEVVAASDRTVSVAIKNVDWRPDDGESLDDLKALFHGLPVSRFEPYRLHNWSDDFARGASERLDHQFLQGGQYHPCSHLWFSLVIAWDGGVRLCCRDTEGRHVVDDTNLHELDEIWNGASFRELRRLHAKGNHAQITECAPCDRVWTGGYAGGTPLRMLQKNLLKVLRS